MSKEGRSWVRIDFGDAFLYLMVFALIVLFSGKPDLCDVILYRLSNGAVQLPLPEVDVPEKE